MSLFDSATQACCARTASTTNCWIIVENISKPIIELLTMFSLDTCESCWARPHAGLSRVHCVLCFDRVIVFFAVEILRSLADTKLRESENDFSREKVHRQEPSKLNVKWSNSLTFLLVVALKFHFFFNFSIFIVNSGRGSDRRRCKAIKELGNLIRQSDRHCLWNYNQCRVSSGERMSGWWIERKLWSQLVDGRECEVWEK